jgi:hypothetical protein
MQPWWNSDAFDLSFLILFSRFLDVMDHILSFNNALEVWLLIWWWNKTFWQKQWSNSDQTVMRQWCNSDAFDYCQCFEMSLIMFYPFVMPWDCVWWHKTFWQKQWWDSDGRFWDVIDLTLLDSDETVMEGFEMSLILHYSFAMQLKCDYASASDTRTFENSSDLTVMRQCCNSVQTVMPLIWGNLCHWSVFIL